MHPDRDVDMAFDALVRGQDPGDAFRALTIFADDVRVVTDGPAPGPSPALAVLLSGTATVPAAVALASRPQRPRASWSSRAVARGVGLGVAAKAALGAAVAATGVAAAGAAGVLPEPVDRAVRSVVELVTPLDVPAHAGDASGGHDHGADDLDTGTTTVGAAGDGVQAPANGGSATAATHGPPIGSVPEAGSGPGGPATASDGGPGPPPHANLGASPTHAPARPARPTQDPPRRRHPDRHPTPTSAPARPTHPARPARPTQDPPRRRHPAGLTDLARPTRPVSPTTPVAPHRDPRAEGPRASADPRCPDPLCQASPAHFVLVATLRDVATCVRRRRPFYAPIVKDC